MKAVFLDRDGVINKEINYLHKAEDFELTHKCLAGLRNIQNRGFQIIIVTNQSGLAKGLFSENEYNDFTKFYIEFLSSEGIYILDVFYCPHHSYGIVPKYSKKCNCRKPLPGLFLKAHKKYNIDLKSSIIVGDRLSDILAGKAAGVGNKVLVESGHELTSECRSNADYIFENLYSFSKSDYFNKL